MTKVMRGDQQMASIACGRSARILPAYVSFLPLSTLKPLAQAFLVTMLGEIAKDMRYFLYIQTATVLGTAFAFRLLNPNADQFLDLGTAVFTTYALLMFADGVGEHEIYQGALTLKARDRKTHVASTPVRSAPQWVT